MKKMIALALSCIIVTGSVVTGFAQQLEEDISVVSEETKNDIEESINEIDEEDIFEHLTYEDMEDIEKEIMQYISENPNVTDEDLDQFSLNMMKEKAEHNILYNPLADGYQWLEASDYEKQYMKEHPRETPSYTYCSNMANSEAKSRYTNNSLWYNGNGDAFRHVFWSSALVKRFHDVLNYDLSESQDASERWTDVHEPPNDRGSLASRMDVQNNTLGRESLAPSTYKKDGYAEMVKQAQNYIDIGLAYRIQEIDGRDKIVSTDDTEKK